MSKVDRDLLLAAKQGHVLALRAMLAQGADVHKADAEGRTALFHAACRGHAGIVQALVDAGADVNRRVDSLARATKENDDVRGQTPLMEAAAGAEVNAVVQGSTALIEAASCNTDAGVVKALVAAGADVNKTRATDTPRATDTST